MITEVITFKLRPGMTREDVVAAYRKTAPIWRANPDCIRKSRKRFQFFARGQVP
jgi:hypothetical protein